MIKTAIIGLLYVLSWGAMATDLAIQHDQVIQTAPVSSSRELQSIETPYGRLEADPIIMDLLQSPPMERIKQIDQSGALLYFGQAPAYSRYEHSLGVWALLKRFNRPLTEQIGGLLHDTSHTVFSHVGDYVFHTPDTAHAYQDTIHLWFLKKMQIAPLLKTLALSLQDIDPDNGQHPALEQALPDICADRLDYNLQTGLRFGKIDQKDVDAILQDLGFDESNQRWYFQTPALAKQFASLSLYFTKTFWGAPFNQAMNHQFASALQEALSLELLNEDDLHFGTDKAVMEILRSHPSPKIQSMLKTCENIQTGFEVLPLEATEYDKWFKPKFRGIDPWIKTQGGFQRLSTLDASFKHAFEHTQAWAKTGFKLRFKQS